MADHHPPPAPLPSPSPTPPPTPRLAARLIAEAIGSGFLIVAILGSGIMAEQLSPDDVGLQLFENAAATAGALVALIMAFSTVSGAHFNPAVSLSERLLGRMTNGELGLYVGAQVLGGCAGAVLTNVMFRDVAGVDGPIFFSERSRDSAGLLLSEVVATIGLLLVIHGASRHGRPGLVAVSVGVWIGGAYFFTSSTSFANPMVSVARTLSDTFAGIAPSSAPGFVAMQVLGALLAVPLIRLLFVDGEPDPQTGSATLETAS